MRKVADVPAGQSHTQLKEAYVASLATECLDGLEVAHEAGRYDGHQIWFLNNLYHVHVHAVQGGCCLSTFA